MASKYARTRITGVLFRKVARHDGAGMVRQYAIQYRDPSGRQHMEVVGRGDEGMTPQKAAQIRALKQIGRKSTAAARKEKNARSTRTGEEAMTLRTLWELYDVDRSDRKSRLDAKLLPHLGTLLEKIPAEITTSDIESMKRRLAETPRKTLLHGERKMLSRQTIALVVGLVKRVLRNAVRMEYIPTLPAGLHIDSVRVNNQKTEVMTDEQLASYLHALDEDRDSLGTSYLRLILATGIRKTAALSLKWDDVIILPGGASLRLRADAAKNGREAIIPLSRAAWNILKSIPHAKGIPYIFPGINGGHRMSFRRTAERVREAAGLPVDWRPIHSLRHVFASYLVSHGASLFEVQKLLTHGSVAMTQRYAHLQDEALRRAVELSDSMLGMGVEKKDKQAGNAIPDAVFFSKDA